MKNKKETIILAKFETPRDVASFSSLMTKYMVGDIDVRSLNKRYVVDARSILGILSLDLSNPVEVVLMSDSKQEIEVFVSLMRQFQYTQI